MNDTKLKPFDPPVLESDIETYLSKQVTKYGGMCEKFKSPAKRSVPDRLIIFPGPHIFFVECKAPGKRPSFLQEQDHKRRRDMGVEVYVIDTKAKVKMLIDKKIEEYGLTV